MQYPFVPSSLGKKLVTSSVHTRNCDKLPKSFQRAPRELIVLEQIIPV
jgi:hypothetical protein